MLNWLPRRFQLRTMFISVAGFAILMAYAGRYIQLRQRSKSQTKEYGLVGILYISTGEVFRTEDLELHYRRCAIFAPANWVDRTFFGGEDPIRGIMFSLE